MMESVSGIAHEMPRHRAGASGPFRISPDKPRKNRPPQPAASLAQNLFAGIDRRKHFAPGDLLAQVPTLEQLGPDDAGDREDEQLAPPDGTMLSCGMTYPF
jgi:hypothetical protein